VTGLGLSGVARPTGEIRLGFRTGMIRSAAVTVGGAGLVGLVIAVINLASKQPGQMFELLSRWGFVWLLVLIGMAFLWDLAKLALNYLGKLADSVQETAVAMNRIADRDDRERDRMTTEISYVGQRMERLSTEHRESRDEQREHNRQIMEMLNRLSDRAGE
jgi:hypothetical protein